jgi:hypothetical protein
MASLKELIFLPTIAIAQQSNPNPKAVEIRYNSTLEGTTKYSNPPEIPAKMIYHQFIFQPFPDRVIRHNPNSSRAKLFVMVGVLKTPPERSFIKMTSTTCDVSPSSLRSG